MCFCMQVSQGGDLIAEGRISAVRDKKPAKPSAEAAEGNTPSEKPQSLQTGPDAQPEPTQVGIIRSRLVSPSA